MNRRLLTILVTAFVVAGGCSLLIYRIIGKRVAQAHQSSTTRIMAAAGDIRLGSILTAENMSVIEVAGTLPKGAIVKAQDAIGRGVLSDIIQGEPILEGHLAPKGAGGGLAATIRPGMRACAVKVDEVVGVAGFVLPGMRVDVLISGDPPGPPDPQRGPLVKTLLQNIQVLSAGADIQKDMEGKPQQVHVVNLLVTPEEAETLSLASNQTHIQLVLRNPLDTEVSKVTGSTTANLYGHVAVSEPQVVERPNVRPPEHKPEIGTVAVQVWNGATHSEEKFAARQVIQ